MLSVATVGRAGAPSNRGWAALRRILLISKLMASVVPLLMRSGDEGGQEFGAPDGIVRANQRNSGTPEIKGVSSCWWITSTCRSPVFAMPSDSVTLHGWPR